MLAQGTAGHIVNTASIAGLLTGRGPAVYRVSKHAVVALSGSTINSHSAGRPSRSPSSALAGSTRRSSTPRAIVRRTYQRRGPCGQRRKPYGRLPTTRCRPAYPLGTSPRVSFAPLPPINFIFSPTRERKRGSAPVWKTSFRNAIRPRKGHKRAAATRPWESLSGPYERAPGAVNTATSGAESAPNHARHRTASSVRACVTWLKPSFHSGARITSVFQPQRPRRRAFLHRAPTLPAPDAVLSPSGAARRRSAPCRSPSSH
jgi:hypothetical protein